MEYSIIPRLILKLKEISNSYGRAYVLPYLIFKPLYHYLVVEAYIRLYRRFGSLNDNLLVFHSVPDYSDNSRALSDYLIGSKLFNKYTIFWAVKDVDYCKTKFGSKRVRFISLTNWFGEYRLTSLKIVMSAKILFGTHNTLLSPKNSKKGQRHILLWHGCSFKKKTGDSMLTQKDFDYALVAGPLFVKTKAEYWDSDEKYILPLGYPRYDLLKNKTESAVKLYNTLKSDAKKLVIWMPTFRNHIKGKYGSSNNGIHFPLLQTQSDWKSLDLKLQQLKVKLAVKIHVYQKKYDIDFDSLNNIVQLTNEDFDSAGVSMYNFLAVTDGLISDYSSVGVDYMIVNRPIAFVLDDYDEYNSKRGFVFDDPRKFMPGNHVYTQNELFSFFEDVAAGKDDYAADRQKMKGLLIHESDCYCKEIAMTFGL